MKITDQHSCHKSYVMNRIRSTSSIGSVSAWDQRNNDSEIECTCQILNIRMLANARAVQTQETNWDRQE